MARLKIFVFITLIILTVIFFGNAYCQAQNQQKDKLIVFHSNTCHKCIEVKKDLMPGIEKNFSDRIILEYRDIADIENYKLLLSLQERYQSQKIENVLPIFFLKGKFLYAQDRVDKELELFIRDSLNAPAKEEPGFSRVDLLGRFKAFKPLAIISAGLIDGINPCAFTVIVFFISFLTLQGYKKRELIIISLSFIFSVFLTYVLVGIGIFGFLYELKNFGAVKKIFNYFIGVFSIALGIFSIYDFFKYKITKNTDGLALQLPASVKERIHSVIGLHYRRSKQQPAKRTLIFSLILSALVTGFLVSILEAVCTGQVYIPTIAFVLKTTDLKLHALGYLLLYNFMFIVPLFMIFIFALWGVTSAQFANIFKRHLLGIKILLAILFLGVGAFLIWRA